MAEINIKDTARERLVENVREYLTVKVTIPLGDPKLKEVHTNSFIWLPLLDYMDLANYEEIIKFYMKYVGSASRGNMKYIRNRWYVEDCNITNDSSGKFQMELTLNPIASSTKNYNKNMTDYQKAFTDALSSGSSNSGTASSTSSSSGTSVASTSGNSTLKGGQGSTIDNLVKKICGSETDQLKKAKLVHEWLKSNVSYSRYCCCKYPNKPEQAYNNRSHLNCGDTAILTCSMMKSAGLTAYIVHRTYNGGHFWCVIEINGKKYASDKTGTNSGFNTVWASSGRTTVSNGGSYSHKESGLSCGCGYYGC